MNYSTRNVSREKDRHCPQRIELIDHVEMGVIHVRNSGCVWVWERKNRHIDLCINYLHKIVKFKTCTEINWTEPDRTEQIWFCWPSSSIMRIWSNVRRHRWMMINMMTSGSHRCMIRCGSNIRIKISSSRTRTGPIWGGWWKDSSRRVGRNSSSSRASMHCRKV